MLRQCSIDLLQIFIFLRRLGLRSIEQIIEPAQVNLRTDLQISNEFLSVHIVDATLSNQYLHE